MKIVRERERIDTVKYTLEYPYNFCKGAGFSFPCDEHGNVIIREMSPGALKNLVLCRSGEHDVTCQGVKKWETHYMQPAIGLCDCGEEVHLTGFTNTCECGADYNKSGQRLASREQWGEETGEHPSDILNLRGDDC